MRLPGSDVCLMAWLHKVSVFSHQRQPQSAPWIKGQLSLSPDAGPGSGLRRSPLILPHWT